jgi:hypothetical protein
MNLEHVDAVELLRQFPRVEVCRKRREDRYSLLMVLSCW